MVFGFIDMGNVLYVKLFIYFFFDIEIFVVNYIYEFIVVLVIKEVYLRVVI